MLWWWKTLRRHYLLSRRPTREAVRRNYIRNHFMPEESKQAGHPIFWENRRGAIVEYTVEDVACRLGMTVQEVARYLSESYPGREGQALAALEKP